MERFKFVLSDFYLGISSNKKKFVIQTKSGLSVYNSLDEFMKDVCTYFEFLINNSK